MMHTLTRQLLTGIFFLLTVISPAFAQDIRRDTLRLEVYFQRGVSKVYPSYRGNGVRLAQFRDELVALTSDPESQVRRIVIRSSVSPEGKVKDNLRLSASRARNIREYLTGQLGLDPGLFVVISGGENWDGLAERIAELDVPWKQDALDIIRNTKDPEERKISLKKLKYGRVWLWLDENIFPDLRSAGGSIACIIQHPVTQPVPEPVPVPVPEPETVPVQEPEPVPVPEPLQAPLRDTVYVYQKPDTVFVNVPPGGDGAVAPHDYDLAGRRFLLALRTNAVAIPLANIGVEIPFGERWSVAADLYYPWIWRPKHATGLDFSGRCFELQALDLEARYWFPNTRRKPEQRLLGHSVGLYVAMGHYDFERNWTGFQGEFGNFGVDYLYACPVFSGRAHLEFELGVGYIYSPAQPYDTFVEGEKAYRRRGVKRYVRWFGPTRAQASLVIPIYSKKQGGGQ